MVQIIVSVSRLFQHGVKIEPGEAFRILYIKSEEQTSGVVKHIGGVVAQILQQEALTVKTAAACEVGSGHGIAGYWGESPAVHIQNIAIPVSAGCT